MICRSRRRRHPDAEWGITSRADFWPRNEIRAYMTRRPLTTRSAFPHVRLVLALSGLIVSAIRAAGATPSPADVEFFEARVRPVLVEHCYKCHSAGAAS